MLDPKLLERAGRDIAAWNKYLASIPVTDRAQWHVRRDARPVFSTHGQSAPKPHLDPLPTLRNN